MVRPLFMKNSEEESQIESLMNRIAAACDRGAYDYVIELLKNERKEWRAQCYREIRLEVERKKDDYAKLTGAGNCYFQTKDGLLTRDRVEVGNYWPPMINRACKLAPPLAIDNDAQSFAPIEMRTYELALDRAHDGRPVYVEV